MTSEEQLLKNIQEHLDVWLHEPKRAIRLIFNEIIRYLTNKI